MKKKPEEKKEHLWDCFSFSCGDSCCQHGADVFPHERDFLISSGVASESDFIGPKTDRTGTILYRTRKGPRGCIFLLDKRGCSLHISGHKPVVCCEWPRTYREAKRAAEKDYLPCFPIRYNRGQDDKNKKP